MTAGVAASLTAVTPSERIKTAMIDDARHDKRFRSSWHATTTIWKEHGILGMYRGFAGTTLKQASATAFRMGTYNVLKDYQKKHDIKQNTFVNFANGCKSRGMNWGFATTTDLITSCRWSCYDFDYTAVRRHQNA
jgi:solute carrier family 25 citrate transporter 1